MRMSDSQSTCDIGEWRSTAIGVTFSRGTVAHSVLLCGGGAATLVIVGETGETCEKRKLAVQVINCFVKLREAAVGTRTRVGT